MLKHGSTAAAVVFLSVSFAAAQGLETHSIDVSHSGVDFKIRHLVSKVSGQFREFHGTIQLDRKNLANSQVSFVIKAASVDTAEPKRDEHLRSADFFDVAKFPELTFKSKKIQAASGSAYNVTGDFTMHGVTKEITIPVEVNGFVKDPWGNEKGGFSTSFKLNRKDYGIVWNKALDTGGFILGDEVEVSINLESVRAKEETAK